MEPTQALLLGLIQGLTEFLPVSSSGHLIIFQQLFGLTEPELFFDVSVHIGTLLAVVVFYHRILIGLFHAAADLLRARPGPEPGSEAARSRRLLWMIVAGSIPTAMIGLGLKPFADQLFSSMTLVGVNLLVTGLLLFLTGLIDRRPRNGGAAAVRTEIRLMDALAIGLVQGFAVLPGISRSGSTISTGLLLGVGKPAAAAYSFILSIPAILGAGLMVLRDAVAGAPFEPAACIIGTTASFGMGYAALKLLVFIVNRGQLSYFAPYCWLAGALALVI